MNIKHLRPLATLFALALVSGSAVHAAGVSVGSSTLLTELDYSDTFTVGTAPRTDGLYNDNSGGAYGVESIFTNPAQNWTPTSNFSFNSGEGSTCCGYPGNAGAANAGADAATGLAQSGGGDFGFNYGLHSNYTIQADAIVPGDRFDISSTSVPGNFFSANSLSVFFRNDGIALPSIGIYNPAFGEVAVPGTTGIAIGDRTWHNFAVNYDQTAKTVKIYVDELLKADLDLTTFGGVNLGGTPVAPGSYQNWSNAAVGMGGAGGVFWADNFQIGGAGDPPPPTPDLPNPGQIPGLPGGLVSYWDFNEADAPVDGFTLNFAYDRQSTNHGRFDGGATRAPGVALGNGLVGLGSAAFDNQPITAVNVGPGVGNNFSTTTGITVEALMVPAWTGAVGDYDEIFRKEDGGNRILLALQNDVNNAGANPPVPDGPVLSFGLNVAGVYSELDMPLDGSAGITLAELQDGLAHHVAATYDSTTGDKQIWIDGVMRWSVNLGAGNLIASGGGADAYIGSVNGAENFTGLLDEVAVWSAGLAGSDFRLHFSNTHMGYNYFFVPFPGDADYNGTTDFSDLGILLNSYNQPGMFFDGDFNGDGIVDFSDLGILLNNYNQSAPAPASAAAVPEPGSLLLAVIGIAGMFCLRKRRIAAAL